MDFFHLTSFNRGDTNMRSEAVSELANIPNEEKFEPAKPQTVPSIRGLTSRSHKLTIIKSQKKEIELVAKIIDEKKDELRGTRLVYKGVHIFSDLLPSVSLKTLSKEEQLYFKKVETRIKKMNVLKPVLSQALFFLSVNLIFIGLTLGLNFFLQSSSEEFLEFIDLASHFTRHSLTLRRLHSILLLAGGIDSGLLSVGRYLPFQPMASDALLKADLADLGVYVHSKCRALSKTIAAESASMESLLDSSALSRPLKENVQYRLSVRRADSSVVGWKASSLYFVHVLTATNSIQALIADLLSNRRRAALDDSLYSSNLQYLSNDLSVNEKEFFRDVVRGSATRFFARLDSIRYMIFGLIGFLFCNSTIALLAFKRIINKFTRIHLSFGALQTEDFVERLSQLRKVQDRMKDLRASKYYLVAPLEEDYAKEGEAKEKTRAPSNRAAIGETNSRSLFSQVWVPVLLFCAVYFCLALISLAVSFMISQKKAQLEWIDRKIEVSRDMSRSYFALYNTLTQYLIFGDGVPVEDVRPSEFLQGYEALVDQSMSSSLKLISEVEEGSSSTDWALQGYLESLYDQNICSKIDAASASLCNRIDRLYAQKGVSQIEKKMAVFFKEVNVFVQSGKLTSKQVLALADYPETELSHNEVYSSILSSVYETILLHKRDFVQDKVRVMFNAFSYIMISAVGLMMAASLLPFKLFARMTREVYFAYQLVSLNSFKQNYYLKRSLQSTFDLRKR